MEMDISKSQLSNKEYEEVVENCIEAIKKTKKQIASYPSQSGEVKEFLEVLQDAWVEEI
jgi:hypothetical protein